MSMSEIVQADLGIKHHLNEPITRHMRRDFSRLNVNQTVGEALETIRRQRPEGRVIYFYVVDDDNRLQGSCPDSAAAAQCESTRRWLTSW